MYLALNTLIDGICKKSVCSIRVYGVIILQNQPTRHTGVNTSMKLPRCQLFTIQTSLKLLWSQMNFWTLYNHTMTL